MEGPKAPATIKESPTTEPITIEVVAKLRQPSSLRAAAPEFHPAKTPSERDASAASSAAANNYGTKEVPLF